MLKPADSAGRLWLEGMVETHLLLAGVLRVIHPEQYHAGLAVMDRLSTLPDIADVVDVWPLPFNAMTCVFNRRAPPHLDTQGHPRMMDLLVNVGSRQEGAQMPVPTVGMTFRYRSGTGLSFSGRLCEHSMEVGEGDRCCLAYYMRGQVMRSVGVPIPGWAY